MIRTSHPNELLSRAELDIRKQKKVADRTYDALRPFFSHVLLAGGAPRNWTIDKPANDLDFYITPNNIFYRWHIRTIEKILETEFVPRPKKRGYAAPWISSVYDGKVSGEKVQLIFLKGSMTPEMMMLNHFDFNLCKIFYRNGLISRTSHFNVDFEQKTMTLNISKLDKTQLGKTVDRYKKMKELFPAFTLRLA